MKPSWMRVLFCLGCLGIAFVNLNCGSTGDSPRRNPSISANEVNDDPVPPADAQWTIVCTTVTTPDHVAVARRIKQEMLNLTKRKGWYVVHSTDSSTVYFGYYREIDKAIDPAEAERARADREGLLRMADSAGVRPFGRAILVRLDALDPVAPSDWNLINAPGTYTLEIAVYKDHPDRKKAAVQNVRELREQGVQAFYFHGPTSSSVCVGAWPETSVKINQVQDPATKAWSFKMDVLDPSLKAMEKQYPQKFLNYKPVGHLDKKTNVKVADPSTVMRIPRELGSAGSR